MSSIFRDFKNCITPTISLTRKFILAKAGRKSIIPFTSNLDPIFTEVTSVSTGAVSRGKGE